MIFFLICGVLCEWVQVLCKVHCECQDMTKCAMSLLGKTLTWETMEGWKEGYQEKLGQSPDQNYSLTLKERGRESWVETSYTIVQSKKLWARLLGRTWCKVSHQRRSMSPGNRSALVSVLLSHWLGAVQGKHGFNENAEMTFRAEQLGSLVNHTPCSWKSTGCVLMATTLIHKHHLFSGILTLWYPISYFQRQRRIY